MPVDDKPITQRRLPLCDGNRTAAGLKVLQSGARIDLPITGAGLSSGMNGRQVADAARTLRPD